MGPTYERPIKAKLIVRLANGEEWEAQDGDYAKFGLVKALHAYWEFSDRLLRALQDHGGIGDDELTATALNPVRFLAETTLCHPDLLDHPEMAETYAEIGQIELALRAAEAAREGGG